MPSKEYYAKRFDSGLCRDCNNPLIKGKKYCLYHLEKYRNRASLRHSSLKEKGLCICGEIKIGKGMCEKCLKKKNILWQSNKKDGLCQWCGEVTDKTYCKICSNKRRLQAKQRRLILTKQGLCCVCGVNYKLENTTLCIDCNLKKIADTYFKDRSRHNELLQIYEKQKGICPYTGRKIKIGLDASIDHIVPRAKNGTNDVSNLQWIYTPCNFMKLDYYEKDFLDIVKMIYEYRIK